MGKVLDFTGDAIADVSTSNVIEGLIEGKVKDLVVVGVTEEGQLYIASECKDIGHVILRLEQAKSELLTISLTKLED